MLHLTRISPGEPLSLLSDGSAIESTSSLPLSRIRSFYGPITWLSGVLGQVRPFHLSGTTLLRNFLPRIDPMIVFCSANQTPTRAS